VSGLIPTARHSAQLVSQCQYLVVFAKCFGNLFMSTAIGDCARLGDVATIGSQARLVDTVWVLRKVSSKGDQQVTLTLFSRRVRTRRTERVRARRILSADILNVLEM